MEDEEEAGNGGQAKANGETERGREWNHVKNQLTVLLRH